MNRYYKSILLSFSIFLLFEAFSYAITTPEFVGMVGNNEGRFNYIGKACLDNSGNIYIADSDNDRIQKLDSNGNFIRFYGGHGTENGKFNFPSAIHVDNSEKLYIADTQNKRIQILDNNGNPIISINTQYAPVDVDVDDFGYIYVLEGNYLSKFSQIGQQLWTIGGLGNQALEFSNPKGVNVDALGNIIVADTGNNRIQIIDPTGSYVSEFFVSNGAVTDVAVDDQGNFYTSELYYHRIGVFDSNGNRLVNVAADYYPTHLHTLHQLEMAFMKSIVR